MPICVSRKNGKHNSDCWMFDVWPMQRSWCQWWGWWWRICRWCHQSLFSLLTPTHTKRELAVTFCLVSGFSLWLGWDKEEEEEEDEYLVTVGSSEHGDRSAYLGKLIDWEESWWGEKGRKVVEGAKRWGSGGYWSCDCSCHNLRYASVLLLHRNAK